MARWVVVSVALMAVGVGVVVRTGIGTVAAPGSRTVFEFMQPGRNHLGSESLRVALVSRMRTQGEVALATVATNQALWNRSLADPPPVPPLEPLTVWLTDDVIRTRLPAADGPAKRLRDVLGAMRREDGWLIRTMGLDVHAGGVPLGMVFERVGATWPISIPAAVRRAYPIFYSTDGGAKWVLIRAWSIAGWSVAIGAVVVFVPPGLVGARRAVRRRGGRCVWCGYSRVGLAEDAVCPECGEEK